MWLIFYWFLNSHNKCAQFYNQKIFTKNKMTKKKSLIKSKIKVYSYVKNSKQDVLP